MKLLTKVLWIIIALLFFACSSADDTGDLPEIRLFFHEKELNYDEKIFIEAHLELDEQYHQDMARAKYRGGWSRQYPKKSFTINLQADPTMERLPRDNDYILSASYIDKTMMRHAYSFQLFRAMTGSTTAAPTTTYVDVHINHEYEGLYLLHPRMDRSFFNLSKSGALFKDPPLFFSEDLPTPEEPGNPFHQKYPKDPDDDRTRRLLDIRQSLMYSDLCNTQVLNPYFNIETIRHWHILLLVTHGSDGLLKNFYLYQKSKSDPFEICIWDYDHSFGRDGDNELNRDTTVLDISRNWLLSGLMECRNYRQSLSAQYFDLRKTGILDTSVMIHKLDSMYGRHRSAIYKNGERWPWDSEHYYDDNDADEEIVLMKDFIRRKMIELDEYFTHLSHE